MKKLWLVMGAVMLLAACTSKNHVMVTGNVGKIENGMLYLKIRDAKQWITLDSCTIENGKFKMQFVIDEPQLAYLTSIPENKLFNNTPLYLEPGNIQIEVNESSNHLMVQGSKLHNEYMDVMNEIDAVDVCYEQFVSIYNQAQQEGDMLKMAATKLQIDSLDSAYIAVIKNHINTHPASPVSLTLINSELIYYLTLQEMETIKAQLDTTLYHTKAIKPMNERIILLRKLEAGQLVEEISLPDTSNILQSLSDMRGKYVLIDFWASWCGPCRRENPALVTIYQKFHSRGFDIFAISLDKSRDAWINAIQQDKLTWTHVSELNGWNGTVSQNFGIISIPSNLLIDQEGKIIARNLFSEQLEETLTPLLLNKQ